MNNDNNGNNGAGTALEHMMKGIKPETARILNKALDGHDISVEDALVLFDTSGLEFNALMMTADEMRKRRVGDIVTYVVNRNINFTNVCI
jgi:2-iminoacetate synthase ThiH